MAFPPPDFAFDYEQFTLERLDHVLPVGFRYELEPEYDLCLLSMECYRAGFYAHFLIEAPFTPPQDDADPETWKPPPILRAMPLIHEIQDDRGNEYTSRMRSGGGGSGGSRDRMQLRWAYCIRPELDPDAENLHLTLRFAENLRYDPDGSPTWTDAEELPGPWRVAIPISNQLEGASP